MPHASRRSLYPLAAACLLLAAGCSGGGDDDGRPAPTCTRWTPAAGTGPGDTVGYFPLAEGDRWTVSSTRRPGAFDSLEVTGTRSVLGWNAAVLVATDLDEGSRLPDTYRAVDDHGVVELGSADATDTLTLALVPYYVARFPVAVGDSYTAVECTNLGWGEDLDGDGKDEFLDVRIAVSVTAIEPVETPIASFSEAARLEQRLTLTLRASGSPQQATEEARLIDWFAPGVGPVREVLEQPLGYPQPASELAGWAVGDAAKGLLARRTIAESFRGPYTAAVREDGSVLLGGRRTSPSGGSAVRAGGVWLAPGGSAGVPFDLFAFDAQPQNLSPPALAAASGMVVAVAARDEPGTGAVVLMQRMGAEGVLLEPPEGTAIGAASPYAAWGRPAIATDGTTFLAAWMAEGVQHPYPDPMLRAVRIGADGAVLGETHIEETGGVTFPRSPVAAFDGTRYLVVYESVIQPAVAFELHAVHVDTAGAVAEEAPIVLSATPGTKLPIAMVFDGTQYHLLLADPRGGRSALVLRRLSPAAEWLDGDAATGGVVLEPALWEGGGASLALAGTTPVVAWTRGSPLGEPDYVTEELWVTRIGPDGAALDLHGGLPGVDAYLGDPAACFGPASPLTLGGADGIPEVLYSGECGPELPDYTPTLRAVRFGL